MDEKITENPSVIMPMIAMRGIVLFPKVVLHFDVGRKKSIAALNDAMKKDQLVFLSAQKDIKDEDLKPGQMLRRRRCGGSPPGHQDRQRRDAHSCGGQIPRETDRNGLRGALF
jgi:hypothetical protein